MNSKLEDTMGAAFISRRMFVRTALASGAGALAATGGVLSPAIGASEALAQTTAFKLPNAPEGIEPFKVSVPQSAIDDLKRRLASTRWPERETVGVGRRASPSRRLRR